MPAPRGANTPRAPGSRRKCTPRTASLHSRGHAHSVEVRLEGGLVGGLYGVLMGKVFFGESMFSRERDASKVALARLVERPLWRTPTHRLPATYPPFALVGQQAGEPRREFSALVARCTAGPDCRCFRDA